MEGRVGVIDSQTLILDVRFRNLSPTARKRVSPETRLDLLDVLRSMLGGMVFVSGFLFFFFFFETGQTKALPIVQPVAFVN